MLRRPTSAPKTLLYASESPAGAGPSWCTRTSLVAQTSRDARIAVVGAEAVAGARFVEEDVRFVAAKVVGDDRVVPGLRRPAKERIDPYHNSAGDGGGAGGDVAREMVAPDLHTARAEKPDPYPRVCRLALRGWALPGVVRNLVCYHLVVADGVRIASEKGQARTVVMNLISDEGTSVRVDDVDTYTSS